MCNLLRENETPRQIDLQLMKLKATLDQEGPKVAEQILGDLNAWYEYKGFTDDDGEPLEDDAFHDQCADVFGVICDILALAAGGNTARPVEGAVNA
jgi:hypothetical protein